jgi:hypothetical protein
MNRWCHPRNPRVAPPSLGPYREGRRLPALRVLRARAEYEHHDRQGGGGVKGSKDELLHDVFTSSPTRRRGPRTTPSGGHPLGTSAGRRLSLSREPGKAATRLAARPPRREGARPAGPRPSVVLRLPRRRDGYHALGYSATPRTHPREAEPTPPFPARDPWGPTAGGSGSEGPARRA